MGSSDILGQSNKIPGGNPVTEKHLVEEECQCFLLIYVVKLSFCSVATLDRVQIFFVFIFSKVNSQN